MSSDSTCHVNNKYYREIFLTDAPMIDVRAPCEFEQGAFPYAINLPIMSDDEREQVGICYKQNGQQSAIDLGHQIIHGDLKTARVSSWVAFALKNLDNGFLYCFRGGLRSRISQQWLADAGVELPLVEGGYKAMRNFLISETERVVDANDIYILSGFTGSAKTKLIVKQKNAIDLEGLANHRGSSFGARFTPQPTQINFENDLAIQLLKHENRKSAFLLLEDESRLIGARSLPLVLKNKMERSPLVMIEESFEYRVEQIYDDYVIKMVLELEQELGKTDFRKREFNDQVIIQYQNYLIRSTEKIKKRLGGVGFKKMLELIEKAISLQQQTGDLKLHKDWIIYLLRKYYDPMYEFQIAKKQHRIKFKGSTSEVEKYLGSL